MPDKEGKKYAVMVYIDSDRIEEYTASLISQKLNFYLFERAGRSGKKKVCGLCLQPMLFGRGAFHTDCVKKEIRTYYKAYEAAPPEDSALGRLCVNVIRLRPQQFLNKEREGLKGFL